MFIGHFSEEPWQDPKWKEEWGSGVLTVSNSEYDPQLGADLYNRYLDEKVYAEEVGFDGLMLNEHHSAAFCMQGVTNVQAAILARITQKAKILLLGNILPIHDDPLWLAEQLAMIDMISNGRLISGFVRGGGTESIAHNTPPHYNRERFEEAHDFIIKTWTTPGPFRWEGKHYHYRYVNPWCIPLQRPHPPIWVPGTASSETVIWAAQHRYPYIMLSTQIEATKKMFQLYRETATECGYKAGPEYLGYMFFVHVEETEEKALEVGRKLTQGVRSPFDPGSRRGSPWLMSPPGYTSSEARIRLKKMEAVDSKGRARAGATASFEDQMATSGMVVGTPETVVTKIRSLLEELRPGTIIFRTGDGAMTHEDQMRTLKYMGQDVIPALKDIGKQLGLISSYELRDDF